MVVIGLALGVLGSLPFTRHLTNLLSAIRAVDPLTSFSALATSRPGELCALIP
jgi:hypothetical protein